MVNGCSLCPRRWVGGNWTHSALRRLQGDLTAASRCLWEGSQDRGRLLASDFGGYQNPAGQSPEQPHLNSGLTLFWAGGHTRHLPRFLLTRITAWFKMFSPKQHLPLQHIFPAESRNVTVMQCCMQHHRTIIFTSSSNAYNFSLKYQFDQRFMKQSHEIALKIVS